VQRHDYDFVFTDLKMPDMDGVEVVKAVHHLRPDVDIAVITGFATVETAVETMQHGALDYVQKPFTEDELTAFVQRLLIKRQARLAAQQRPRVRVGLPTSAEAGAAPLEYQIPGGAFLSSGHVWARLEDDGRVRLGLDDFGRRALGKIESVGLPNATQHLRRGDVIATLKAGGREVKLRSPLRGIVAAVNDGVRRAPAGLLTSPYEDGWLCLVEPQDLSNDLAKLRIGKPAVEWYQDEIERLRKNAPAGASVPPIEDWAAFERDFLAGGGQA
jgi:glycine cleavage system H lipoate-binding protein